MKPVLLLTLILFIIGCKSNSSSENKQVYDASDRELYGGLFRMNIGSECRSFFPHDIVDASATSLMSQVYEGLLRIDPVNKSIVPALAESYDVSANGTTYTFHIRKGVRFHDDKVFENGKGRELKAQDVVFCFQKICEPSKFNQLYAFVIDLIKGGRKHYESGGNSLSTLGIKAIDDYTVEISLEYPAPTFLSVLTHPCSWIFPKELFQYNNDITTWCIGTGPFEARTIKMNEVIILQRNQNYWRLDNEGNRLPYLDAIRCNFVMNENEQLNLFLDDKLDLLMQVPLNRVAMLKDNIASSGTSNYRILTTPGLRVEYYGFLQISPTFADKRVRKAINYAIDRRMLVDSVLQGYGEVASHGVVPGSMPNYDAQAIKGYEYNPSRSRTLLAAAGFKDGKDFPVLALQVNEGSENALKIAEAVQKMIFDNLNITIEISVLSRDLHYDQIENGHVNFFRDGWIADYADPENFLRLFYGKLVPEDTVKASFLNSVRFKNDSFDLNFEASLRELDVEQRFADYAKADQILMDEAAIVPLYFEKWVWLVQNKVQNLDVTGIGVLNLSKVHFAHASP